MLVALARAARRRPVPRAGRDGAEVSRVHAAGRAAGAGRQPAAAQPATRGWQFLQAGDLKNAEREFAAALKRDAGVLSGGDRRSATSSWRARTPKAALPHFDRALERPQHDDVSALVGRGAGAAGAEPRSRRARRVRGGAGRRSVADRPRAPRRGAAVPRRRAGPGRARGRRRAAGTLDEAVARLHERDRQLARQRVPVSRARGRRAAAGRRRRGARALPQGGRARPDRRAVRWRRSARSSRRAATSKAPRRRTPTRWRIEPSDGRARRRLDARARADRRWRACRRSTARSSSAPQITRGDLAALIGVRLAPLLQAGRRARRRRRSPTSATTGRRPGSWRSRAPA